MSEQVVSISLATSTVYVSGTVNGTAYTWTRNGDAWQATVPRAEDDTYLVSITAVNAAGASASYDITLYYGTLHLITDRTAADVARVRTLAAKGWDNLSEDERAEWLAGLKGAYSAVDLNRVGSAMNELAAALVQLPETAMTYLASRGVAVDDLFAPPWVTIDRAKARPWSAAAFNWTQKNTWARGEKPTPDELALYLARVKQLRAALDYETDALPDTMPDINHEAANAIEKALELLAPALDAWEAGLKADADRAAASWYYSGEIVAGDV